MYASAAAAFDQDFAALTRFDCQGARALSLYLLTDPARDAGRNLRAQLDALLHPIAETLPNREEQESFERDVAIARELVTQVAPPARGLALFVCAQPLLRHVVPLRFPLAPQAYYEDRLHLLPLLSELDEHERALVVLLDKERMRLFRIFMGRIEALADFTDDVPGKHSMGGYSQQHAGGPTGGAIHFGHNSATIQRHHEWHVRLHVDRVLETLKEAQAETPVQRIMLAATPEVRAEFIRLMPRRWRNLVDHQLKLPMFATEAEVLAGALAVQEVIERSSEEELVEALGEAGRAARGGEAVAQAVADGAVATLIYAQNAQLSGAVCSNCGWLMVDEAPEACARCQGAVRPHNDVIELCIERVLRQGGRVEEVRGRAAQRMERFGWVGALLRWQPEPW